MRSQLLKLFSLAYALVVAVSAGIAFSPIYTARMSSHLDYPARIAASPLKHVCFVCGKPATRSVQYTIRPRYFCATCTPPKTIYWHSDGSDYDPASNGKASVLILAVVHLTGFFLAFMLIKEFCFGRPSQIM